MKLPRLVWNRGLRPESRSSALTSMAESLGTIAYALKIIVIREYGVDLDAPPPTRADREREVFDPMYPDNMREAVDEEIERLRGIELDTITHTGVRPTGVMSGVGAGRGNVGPLRSMRAASQRSADSVDDDLTPEERRFLHEELGQVGDGRGDDIGDDGGGE